MPSAMCRNAQQQGKLKHVSSTRGHWSRKRSLATLGIVCGITPPYQPARFQKSKSNIWTEALRKVQRYEPEPSGCMYNIAQTSGLSISSFLMPPIGFMLYHLYKDKEPKKAECIKDSAYKGMLFLGVALVVFLIIVLGKLINA